MAGKITGSTSAFLSFDWSIDSSYLKANSLGYELLFYNMSNYTYDPSGPSNWKDTEFASIFNKLGLGLNGIFPPWTDGSHVNGVC